MTNKVITTLKTENSTDYKRLFAAAYDYLVENKNFLPADRQASIDAMTGITSVQGYFAHIKDILDIGEAKGREEWPIARKYLMLPLDEPYFEVDANKREIIVPAEFKKNGISVQGDNIAESLIFKINRFFDYIDLAKMEVRVQWENANKENGVSDVYVVDASKDVDYLFIMWPLTDEITKYPGTVKFSLRFYKSNGGQLSYSFSTKIAAATINSSHDFADDVVSGSSNIDNAVNAFSNSIENSINTAQEKPKTPFFLIDLDDAPATGQAENADYNSGEVIEAYVDETNPNQVLRVEATSTDAGVITYEWKYIDTVQPAPIGGNIYKITGTDEYRAIPETEIEAVPHKMYYTKTVVNGADVYTPTEFRVEEGLELYEKTNYINVFQDNPYDENHRRTGNHLNHNTSEPYGASANHAIPHVAGKYYAIAKNTVGDNSAINESLTIVFPAPEHLEFTETGNLAPNNYLRSTGEGSISVTVEVDERGAKPTYQWLFSNSLTGTYVPINDPSLAEDANKWSVNESGNTLTITNKPGYYKALVTSTRNYEQIHKESEPTKVTMPLGAPVIVTPAGDIAVSSLYGDATLTVEVEPITDPLLSEGITYQWFNDQDEAIASATTETLVVPRGTRMGYYCIVTNHMGADTKSTKSPDFSVNPITPVVDQEPANGGASENQPEG